MRLQLQLDGKALQEAYKLHLPAEGLAVPGCEEVALMASVSLRVTLPGGGAYVLGGRVVNKAPGGLAFVYLDGGPELRALREGVERAVKAPAQGSASPQAQAARPAVPRNENGRVVIDLTERARLEAVRKQELVGGGLQIAQAHSLKMFASVPLRVRFAGGVAVDVDGKIVNKAPSGHAFVYVGGIGVDRLVEAADAALAAPASLWEEDTRPG